MATSRETEASRSTGTCSNGSSMKGGAIVEEGVVIVVVFPKEWEQFDLAPQEVVGQVIRRRTVERDSIVFRGSPRGMRQVLLARIQLRHTLLNSLRSQQR